MIELAFVIMSSLTNADHMLKCMIVISPRQNAFLDGFIDILHHVYIFCFKLELVKLVMVGKVCFILLN